MDQWLSISPSYHLVQWPNYVASSAAEDQLTEIAKIEKLFWLLPENERYTVKSLACKVNGNIEYGCGFLGMQFVW